MKEQLPACVATGSMRLGLTGGEILRHTQRGGFLACYSLEQFLVT